MRLSIETARTVMRPFKRGDAAEAFLWFSDPEVMRYIPYGTDSTIDETAVRIARYIDHQKENRFSKWAIMDRDSHRLIGDAGLYLLPEGKGVELGYRLSRRYWGRGLATEIAKKWINLAYEFTNKAAIFAFAHPDNSASLRVIHKLGFKYSRDDVLYGLRVPLFELSLNSSNSEQGEGDNSE